MKPELLVLIINSRSTRRTQLLDQVANALGVLEVKGMPPFAPGDCFFVALAMAFEQLAGFDVTVPELRTLLAGVLPSYTRGWRAYRDEEPVGVRSSLQTMVQLQQYVQTPAHWANDQTLLIFSQVLDVNWVVLVKSAACAADLSKCALASLGVRPTGADTYIILLYDADNHYDLVQRVDGQCVFSAATLPPWLWSKYKSMWVDNKLPPVTPVLRRVRRPSEAE